MSVLYALEGKSEAERPRKLLQGGKKKKQASKLLRET